MLDDSVGTSRKHFPSKRSNGLHVRRCTDLVKKDPHRLGQPLEIETKNKVGMVVQKMRSSIRGNLLLEHNSSLTIASNLIIPQNISSIEGIASVVLFTSQTEQNREPFSTHLLPNPIASNKKALVQRAVHGTLSS